MNRWAKGRFQASSAGSHPLGRIHPFTVDVLQQLGHTTESLRSKSWEAFARPDSPPLDFIFTLCDKAAGEACPIWPGRITAHWGVEDPAAYRGSEDNTRAVFVKIYTELDTRIKLFLNLPLHSIDSLSLRHR